MLCVLQTASSDLVVPPTLDPLLNNALSEIQLLKLGYTRSKDIDNMSYFMVKVRQIAASVDSTLHRSVI